MQMLVLIFRQSLEEDVRQILKDLNVKGFTQTSNVIGSGQTGAVPSGFGWPGFNEMLFAALEDDQMKEVVERFRAFQEQVMRQQRGARVPMRMFVMPCEQVL